MALKVWSEPKQTSKRLISLPRDSVHSSNLCISKKKKEIQRKSRKCSLDRLHSSISVSAAARSSNARDTLSKRLRVLRCKPLVRIVRINKPIMGRFILGHSTLRLGQRSPNVKKSVVANFRARFPTTNGVYFEMIDMSFPWLAMC